MRQACLDDIWISIWISTCMSNLKREACLCSVWIYTWTFAVVTMVLCSFPLLQERKGTERLSGGWLTCIDHGWDRVWNNAFLMHIMHSCVRDHMHALHSTQHACIPLHPLHQSWKNVQHFFVTAICTLIFRYIPLFFEFVFMQMYPNFNKSRVKFECLCRNVFYTIIFAWMLVDQLSNMGRVVTIPNCQQSIWHGTVDI